MSFEREVKAVRDFMTGPDEMKRAEMVSLDRRNWAFMVTFPQVFFQVKHELVLQQSKITIQAGRLKEELRHRILSGKRDNNLGVLNFETWKLLFGCRMNSVNIGVYEHSQNTVQVQTEKDQQTFGV